MKSPFRFQGTIAPSSYVVASVALLIFQYVVQGVAFAIHDHLASGFWHFARPVSVAVFASWMRTGWRFANWPLQFSLVVDFAVAWLLLALAIRRARTADRSMLTACLAIVPVIQIPVIFWLGSAAPRAVDDVSSGPYRVPVVVAFKGLIAGLIATLALEFLSTLVFGTYGLGLFFASPFFIGCVTGYIGNRHSDIGWGSTARLVMGACFLGLVGLVAVAVEGAICLAMATPLILVMAVLGGVVGRAIALKGPGAAPARTAMSIVALPLFFAIDLIAPPHTAFESVESIEVAATDRDVWDAIVHMGPIPDPPSVPFRWGLAYPLSGSIRGGGVGAIREGVFSTGVAYERVTEWNPAKHLSFIVLSDPPSMHELSPYQHVNAPHVNEYFRTLDARFTITQLTNGRTQLSLATRHELDLSPGFYWLPMAKWAIHANKLRVLAHFAQQAEATAKPTRQAFQSRPR